MRDRINIENINVGDVWNVNEIKNIHFIGKDIQKPVLLLHVITPVELKAVKGVLLKYGMKMSQRNKGGFPYISVVGFNSPVYITISEMGSTGVGAVMNVLQEAIEKLNITMVIMCGIAFGTNRDKTALGDIIVSRQVWNYEPAKVKPEGLAYRGDKVNAASRLLQCFKMAAADYQDMPKIHFGLMASGEKLVNDREFRDKLSVQEPELVAGDMEAAGLASVCMSKKVDWIVVKALCDWGENKSDKFQEEAAWNAAEVVVLTVKGYLLPV